MPKRKKASSIYIGTRVEVFKAFSSKTNIKFVICVKKSRVHDYLKKTKMKIYFINKKNKKNIFKLIKNTNVEVILSAGFPYIIPVNFLDKKKILINSHPSYLPKFKGADAINDAIKSKSKEIGVTVHKISKKVDSGKIIYKDKINISKLKREQIYQAIFKVLEPSVILKSLKLLKI